MEKNSQQMRFSDNELELLKKTFKDNEHLLKLLRKIFLPEYDFSAPLGQVMDLWLTVDVRNLDPQQAYVRLLARNELITHVETMLLQINSLANMKLDTPEEVEAKKKKDSMK